MRSAAATVQRGSPVRGWLLLGLAFTFECAAVAPPAGGAEAAAVSIQAGAPSAAAVDLDDPARIEAGRKRFNKTCAGYCHGFEGKGGRAPDFRGRTDLPPQFAFDTITRGRTGADVMPPWGGAFSVEQIWELVAYLQYLGRQPAE
ncbi:cytochrome c [Aromatoleum diolicum]|uniref:Cytochrome c n=2 Tax=Aromatoleum diolicum TaxID=75796 RepID=A0ABX1Q697_9RHOO|nr:cytochrome c [Aromatoleum diolicum]